MCVCVGGGGEAQAKNKIAYRRRRVNWDRTFLLIVGVEGIPVLPDACSIIQ